MIKCVMTLIVFFTLLQYSNAEQKQTEEGLIAVDFQNKHTTITADKLVLHAKTRKFSYLDNVKVVQEDMIITCERMDGNYTEQNEIETLVATNNVNITKGANIKASGNKAVYLAKNETIELTESPQVEQEGSILAADKVIIYVNEDRSEAVGNVSVTLKEKAQTNDTRDSPVKGADKGSGKRKKKAM